jgi:hypothetical protein
MSHAPAARFVCRGTRLFIYFPHSFLHAQKSSKQINQKKSELVVGHGDLIMGALWCIL